MKTTTFAARTMFVTIIVSLGLAAHAAYLGASPTVFLVSWFSGISACLFVLSWASFSYQKSQDRKVRAALEQVGAGLRVLPKESK